MTASCSRKRWLYRSFLKAAIRRRKKSGENLLRHLPEDILQVIISQLTLRDAARMSTLSRMWKSLWNSHSNLSFDGAMTMIATSFHAKRYAKENKFIDVVDTVLRHHCGTNLKRFKVAFQLRKKHAASLDSWIGFAVSSKASEIVLDLDPRQVRMAEDAYDFPFHLFSNGNNIQCIWLKCASLKPPRDFYGFKRLTKLMILGVRILEDIGDLLSNCCSLKRLDIVGCEFGKLKLHGTFHRLQHLGVMQSALQAIELHAPDLVTFKYVGLPLPMVFEESPKLIVANIKLWPHLDHFGYVCSGLSTAFPCLEDLYLDVFIQTEVPQSAISTMKFKYLRYVACTVYISGCADDQRGILRLASIMKLAPFLEKFELHMDACMFASRYVDVNVNPLSSPHKHLKTVHMTGFIGLLGQIELALYILENARSLQSMTIDPFVFGDIIRSEEAAVRSFDVQVGRENAHKFLDIEKYRNVLTVL